MSKTNPCESPGTDCEALMQPAFNDSMPIQPSSQKSFTNNASIIHRNYTIAGARREELLRTCDLCAASPSFGGLNGLDNGLQLCDRCVRQYHAISESLLRRSLARFLIGNVV